MKARVTVTLKTGVLDPQGKAIEGALTRSASPASAGPPGQVFEIELAETDRPRPSAASRPCASKLLANTVIENYARDRAESAPSDGFMAKADRSPELSLPDG